MSKPPAPNAPDEKPRAAWHRRKSARPQEILDAATQLLEEEGTADLAMAQIAKRAGVSEATIYKYFESKQALLSEVFAQWAKPFVARLNEDMRSIADLHAQLVTIGLQFLRGLESTPRLHTIFYREIRWTDYRGTQLHKINHDFAKTVVDAVQAGIERGEVRADVNPAMVRDALFGGLEHIAMRTIFAGRPLDIGSEVAAYVDLLLGGIRTPTPKPDSSPDEASRLAAQIDRLEALLAKAGKS